MNRRAAVSPGRASPRLKLAAKKARERASAVIETAIVTPA